MSKIDFNILLNNNNNNTSIFDSALKRTSNLLSQSNIVSPIKQQSFQNNNNSFNMGNNKDMKDGNLKEKIDRILANFDKLT